MDHLSNAKNSTIAAIPTTAKKFTFLQLKLSPAFLSSDSHCGKSGFPFAQIVISSCCTSWVILAMRKQLN